MEDGIKTFPFPTKLDDRIKMIELEFGIKGYAVVWKLHQAIYSVGYYLKWDIDAQLLFMDDYRLSEVGRNCVSEIVASCIRRGVFESSLYDKYGILTSDEIQETFLTAKARSKKVIVNEDYALPIVYTFIENASKNGKNVNIFFKNADISKQKKGKEKKEKEIPPLPPMGEAHDRAKEEFLKLYPSIVPKGDDSFMDYAKLKESFARSQWLRNTYSFNWIKTNYQAIIDGAYEDDRSKTNEVDERAERERYYAANRQRAISLADAVIDGARKDPEFFQAEKEMKRGEIELAKAELYSPNTVLEIQKRLDGARMKRARALSRLQIREEDLLPKFTCEKCSDTGFLPSGHACDCYQRSKNGKS